jgi:hypothetical protein
VVATYRYPPELWTVPLTGAELISIDPGSVYPVQVTLSLIVSYIIAGNFILPTADPHIVGAWWNNGGFVCVSAG